MIVKVFHIGRNGRKRVSNNSTPAKEKCFSLKSFKALLHSCLLFIEIDQGLAYVIYEKCLETMLDDNRFDWDKNF